MMLLRQTCGWSLLCACMLGAVSHAQDVSGARPESAFTSKEELNSMFDLEGNTPFPSPYAGTLHFSALASKFDSGHGHGYRNELKIGARQRRSLERTHEHFSAQVTPTLPNGAKTIVAQYHVDGLDTILKVYVQDTADSRLTDGKANNGIFDVMVKIRGASGKEMMTALGTVRSGERFALDINFVYGDATVTVNTEKNGTIQTERTRIKGDNRNIYFKFGDYLQALDSATLSHTTSPAQWDEYYRLHQIDSSQISFSQIKFERK